MDGVVVSVGDRGMDWAGAEETQTGRAGPQRARPEPLRDGVLGCGLFLFRCASGGCLGVGPLQIEYVNGVRVVVELGIVLGHLRPGGHRLGGLDIGNGAASLLLGLEEVVNVLKKKPQVLSLERRDSKSVVLSGEHGLPPFR